MEMTRAVLRDICAKNKLYRTPNLNDKLYLNFKGFTHIAALEEYTALKALFLEGNALQSLEGMPRLEELKCLYVQQNCLRSLQGLEQLPNLNTLNISSNGLASLSDLQSCPQLSTLIAERNHLSTAEGLAALLQCTSLHTLDLQHNKIEDTAVIDDIITQLPQLRCLYLAGNPVVSKVPNYRKSVIARCSQLTYLDDRPVSDEERLLAEAWVAGGIEGERAERVRQKEEEAAKQRRNFEWMQQLRREGFRKRRAMLGLPDGDTDPYLDTLPDQESRTARSGTAAEGAGGGDSANADEGSGGSDDGGDGDDSSVLDEMLQDPPELVAARKRLAAYQLKAQQAAGEGGNQQHMDSSSNGDGSTAAAAAAAAQAEAGSAEDGAVYLESVKAAQHELDAACVSSVAPIRGATGRVTAATGAWPGPTATGHDKLASMRAATQAALAAIGLDDNSGISISSSSAPAVAASRRIQVIDSQEVETEEESAEPTKQPDSFDLGLVDSWSSGGTDPAPAAAGGRASAVADSDDDGGVDVEEGGTTAACAPEDVVVRVGGGGLYDLD